MAKFSVALLFGAFLAVGVSLSDATSDCATLLTDCMSKVRTSDDYANKQKMCTIFQTTIDCLQDAETKCEGPMGVAAQSAQRNMENQKEKLCNDEDLTSGGSSTAGMGTGNGGLIATPDNGLGQCGVPDYFKCLQNAKEDDMCPAFRCVQKLRTKCKGKGFSHDMSEKYKKLEEECDGCANIRPSVLLLLATTLVIAVRSYF